MPLVATVLCVVLAVKRRLHNSKPGAGVLSVMAGRKGRVSGSAQRGMTVSFVKEDGTFWYRLARGLVPEVAETAEFDCAVVLHGQVCCGLLAGKRLFYNSRAVARLLGLRLGWLLVPFAAFFVAGVILDLAGQVQYGLSFKGGSLSMNMWAHGMGLFYLIVLWLALIVCWIVSYFVRTGKLLVRVERELSRLGPAVAALEQAPAKAAVETQEENEGAPPQPAGSAQA